jgi:hypothetical protein
MHVAAEADLPIALLYTSKVMKRRRRRRRPKSLVKRRRSWNMIRITNAAGDKWAK